jgi:hypothetical protein
MKDKEQFEIAEKLADKTPTKALTTLGYYFLLKLVSLFSLKSMFHLFIKR